MPEQRSTTIRLDEDGDLTPGSPNPYAWIRERLPLFADGEVKLSMGRPTRSLDQNAFYWSAVLGTVHQGLHDAGIDELHLIGPGGDTITIPVTVRMLHEFYKRKFLTPDEPGEEPTTTTLDTTAMTEYIESIKNDPTVRELDIEIPSPDRPPVSAYE